MSEINNKRLEKQWARDERVARLHAAHPDLAALDKEQKELVAKLVREAIKDPDLVPNLDQRYRDILAQKETLLANYGISPDVYQPDWDCPICQDRGMTKDGRPCACRQKDLQMRRYREAGLPDNAGDMRFENFDASLYTPETDAADKVNRLKTFISKLAQGVPMGNVVLRADIGRGKTHLALATAQAALDAGLSVYYVRADQLMENLRNDLYGDASTGCERHRVKNCDLLVIDDLGRESVSEFVITQLTDLIEDRNASRRSWFINTNLKGQEIADRYGARLSDRIFEKATFFFLERKGSIRRLKGSSEVDMV